MLQKIEYPCTLSTYNVHIMANRLMLLAIVAPVRQIYLTVEDTPVTENKESTVSDRSPSTPGRVRFVDGQARYVRCVAVGGYPTPSLHLYVNERDLTASTRLVEQLSMHGQPGLRMLVTRTERQAGSSGGLVLSVDDDGSRLRCVARVPGLASNITETTIDVHCKHCAHVACFMTSPAGNNHIPDIPTDVDGLIFFCYSNLRPAAFNDTMRNI